MSVCRGKIVGITSYKALQGKLKHRLKKQCLNFSEFLCQGLTVLLCTSCRFTEEQPKGITENNDKIMKLIRKKHLCNVYWYIFGQSCVIKNFIVLYGKIYFVFIFGSIYMALSFPRAYFLLFYYKLMMLSKLMTLSNVFCVLKIETL